MEWWTYAVLKLKWGLAGSLMVSLLYVYREQKNKGERKAKKRKKDKQENRNLERRIGTMHVHALQMIVGESIKL